MAVAPGPGLRTDTGGERGPGGGGDTGTAPGTTTTPVAGAETGIGGTVAQSGGSLDMVGSIPGLTIPTGQAVLIREGPVQFRWILDRFEGNDTFRSATEIGELQAVTTKNVLTDQQTIRKRGGSADVNSSGAVALVGLHESSGERTLTLDAMDATTGWVTSDGANLTITLDTTVKVESTGALRFNATGAGADTDTIKKDLGAGATVDLSKFDFVEVEMRGVVTTGNSITFGVS